LFGCAVGLFYDIVLTVQRLIAVRLLWHLLDFLSALVWGIGFICCVIGYAGGSFRGAYVVCCIVGIVIYLATFHRLFNPLLHPVTKKCHQKRRMRPKK